MQSSHLLFVRVHVCVRSRTDGVSRGGDQVAEQTTQQIPQSFSVRCVFFFCVCA